MQLMPRRQIGSSVTIALLLGISSASGQVNPKFVLPAPDAKKIGERNMINLATAKAIVAACQRMALAHNGAVAIVILDNFGVSVLQERMDGAAARSFQNVNTAMLKARTALLIRAPSSTRALNVQRQPTRIANEYGQGYFPASGGLPIWVDDQIIGFIGVGGVAPQPGWSDERCAYDALTEVLGPQPPLPDAPAQNR